MNKDISISISTILKIIAVLGAVWFVFLIRDVVILLIFAIVLVSAIEPFVGRMENRKIPRVLSVSVAFILGLVTLGAVLFFLVPPIIVQLKQLALDLPGFVDMLAAKFEVVRNLASRYNLTASLEEFTEWAKSALSLEKVASYLTGTVKAFFGGLISAFIILAISFYMAVEKGGLKKFIGALFPQKHSENAMRLVKKSQNKLNRWIKGQLVVILIVGLLDYIGLAVMGFKFALLLGILGALLEIIPYAGPIIATVFAVIIGLTQSPMVAVFAGAWFLIVQQLENHIITPKVMQTTVGLNPVVVILAILIGTKLAGVFGLILAVPVAAVLEVVIGDFMSSSTGSRSG